MRKKFTVLDPILSLLSWLALKLTGAAVGLFPGVVFLADPEDAILPTLPASPAQTLPVGRVLNPVELLRVLQLLNSDNAARMEGNRVKA